jgi:ABC-type uncharacterized transport system auxiliary subunit
MLKKIILLTIPLLFCGCGSLIKQPAPIISYYQLNYTPEISNNTFVNKTILIKSFYISETYNRDTILYSSDKYKCDYYPYKQWISAPQTQITESFRNDFMKSGAFKAIIIPGQLQKSDLILAGAITEIRENIRGENSSGILKISVTLIKSASKKTPSEIIFQKNYEKSVPCETKNTESLVKALSQAAKEISAEVIKDVIEAASKDIDAKKVP